MISFKNFVLLSTIAIHFFFLLILFISPSFIFHKKEHKPLIVKTIINKPQARINTAIEKKNPPSAQKQAQPSKKPEAATVAKAAPQKTTPPVKKEPAIGEKQLSKNKPSPAKKNPPPQNRAKISDSLLKELEESIAKIENKGDKKVVHKKESPNNKSFVVYPLQIDTASMQNDPNNYTDTLIDHLHQYLSLPDYGEVKIQLSLRQDGTVVKVVIVKTQSEKNKQYLESTLPGLRFPPFDAAHANKENTFTLTFCNEL